MPGLPHCWGPQSALSITKDTCSHKPLCWKPPEGALSCSAQSCSPCYRAPPALLLWSGMFPVPLGTKSYYWGLLMTHHSTTLTWDYFLFWLLPELTFSEIVMKALETHTVTAGGQVKENDQRPGFWFSNVLWPLFIYEYICCCVKF